MNQDTAGQKSANAGHNTGSAIKSGITKVHGLGETLRGNINAFADNVTNTDDTKSRNVAERGMQEVNTGVYRGTGAGVTPHDTAAERVNRDAQGEGGHIGTGHGTYHAPAHGAATHGNNEGVLPGGQGGTAYQGNTYGSTGGTGGTTYDRV